MSPQSRPAPVKIKREAEIQALENLQKKPPDQRVKIYVGKNNAEIEVGLEDLGKSPILKALISKLGAPGPYIMHPKLTTVNADHFQSVREFLLTDEYMPALVNNPHGEDVLPKQLDGCTSVDHYENEALRGAHLYVLAEKLEMRTLQALVFRKITQAQFHKYGIKCLLDLAMVMFSRPQESDMNGKGRCKRDDDDNNFDEGDALENWLVEALKNQFQATMIHHARQFFRVANHGACKKRGFGVRVLRSKVDDWEALGPDFIASEDDD
ncbi:uncharacterized protein A1O5_09556 [Cladophialophora psammophila CBS 110553]|uniref:BTB domain-containing protein n=1 Tax=Cladophialophora psammophila CBS 110553 TaxID=1182543 RepID=W9WI07_9EURO|nr:uncharacterized protein A1O5_09556 [Cladophialophora psammophila CBS 110553]EXJ67543.1 hypothetical protein A1O5_09556 [Cladophialophora psammophila CBS 110553]